MDRNHLLDKIKAVEYWQEHFANKTFMKALRAVVELHKPQEITLPNGDWGSNCAYCDIGFEYPCPTIEAIEKALE